MIRVLIVDDEAPARDRMTRIVGQFADTEVIGVAENGIQALEEIERLAPDMVFLDIEMPELDGLGVASTLGASGPAIVFVTAYSEHALKAFEVCAIDYLVKPVTEKRVKSAIEKVRKRTAYERPDLSGLLQRLDDNRERRGEQRFAVKCGAKFVVFDPKRVSAVISKDHYSAIIFEGRELLADEPLDVLLAKLNPQQFIRVHRGAVINVEYLAELEREGDRKYIAVLSDKGKTRVSVSRERLSDLKSLLGIT